MGKPLAVGTGSIGGGMSIWRTVADRGLRVLRDPATRAVVQLLLVGIVAGLPGGQACAEVLRKLFAW